MSPKPPIPPLPLVRVQSNPLAIHFNAPKVHRRQQISSAAAANPPAARWLTDLKARVGKCIIFGLSTPQIDEAGEIMRTIAREWRELVAGSEGFLTGKGRGGLERREVVWGEMDVMGEAAFEIPSERRADDDVIGHVNNVNYIRYAESARINWAQNFANHVDPKRRKEWSELWMPKGHGLILRSIKVDFKFPMAWPDKISVYHKLRAKPTVSMDSFLLDVIILSEKYQRPAARCLEDIVVYDYQHGSKSPLQDFMVDSFRETFVMQEETRRQNEVKVRDILERVERLEKASWDRPDAVEDMGTAPSISRPEKLKSHS